MKCIYCGEEIKEGCIYCSACGKEAQIVPDYNEFEDDYINGLVGRDTDTRRISQNELSKAEEQKKKKEKAELKARKEQQKKIIIISAIVISVTVIVLIFTIISTVKNRQANSFDYQLSQAEKAVEASDIDNAIMYYENALNLDRDNIKVRYRLADIYMDQNDPESALILYQEIINLDSTQIDSYKNIISIYEDDGNYEAIAKLAATVKDADILALFDDYVVDSPIFSIDGGNYDSEISVELETDSPSSVVYYTLDGSDPVTSGDVYEEEIEFKEEGTYTVKAVTKSDKGLYSDVVSQKYKIEFKVPDTPVVTPDGGTLTSEDVITIEVPEGCVAYYTWDSSDPNISSEQYVDGIAAPEGNNVLSVVIYNPSIEKFSDVYRVRFEYYN